jgi:hypothetical protein
MIDPDKLPADAVQAAYAQQDNISEARLRKNIAAFLDAVLADDEAMERLIFAYTVPSLDYARDALTAAVQEDSP